VQDFPQTFFTPHHLLKGSFEAKYSNMEKLEIRDLFFVDCTKGLLKNYLDYINYLGAI
jgi:hypothetical protein